MPKYGDASKRKLGECNANMQKLFNEVIKVVDITIVCGHRGRAEQNLAYDQGKSRLRYPKSGHNKTPSNAVDIAKWYAQKPHIRWNVKSDWHYVNGVVRGIAHTMGIKLKPIILWDMGHFEEGV